MTFKYRAMNSNGIEICSSVEADSEADALVVIRGKGQFPISIMCSDKTPEKVGGWRGRIEISDIWKTLCIASGCYSVSAIMRTLGALPIPKGAVLAAVLGLVDGLVFGLFLISAYRLLNESKK